MATDVLTHHVESIDICARLIWQYLNQMASNNASTLGRLTREVDASRDLVMQSVGWLAREGKVTFKKGPRSEVIALC